MELLSLLSIVLLFTCSNDSTGTPTSKEPTSIVVEMEPTISDMTDISGMYTLQTNREYSVREGRKYKVLLVKNTYKGRGRGEKDILSYGIFDVAEKGYVYYAEGIDIAKRLERNWELYDDTNNPANTNE